jgi:hypothetical protein
LRVFLLGDENHKSLVKEVESLLVKYVELVQGIHQVLLYNFPTTRKEKSNKAIWPWCLFFWCRSNHNFYFFFREGKIQVMEISRLPIQLIEI